MGATRQPRMIGAGGRSGGPMNGLWSSQRRFGGGQPQIEPYASGILQRRSPQEELGFGGPPQPAGRPGPGSPIDSGPFAGPVMNPNGTPAGGITRPPIAGTLPTAQPRSTQDRVREMIDRARRMGGRVAPGVPAPAGGDPTSPGVRRIGSSFWSGDTLQVDTTNQQYAPLRNRLQQTLMDQMGGIRAERPQGPGDLAGPGRFSMEFGNLPDFSRRDIRDVSGPYFGRGDMVQGSRIGRADLGPAAMTGAPNIRQANLGDAPQVNFGGFSPVDRVGADRISDYGVGIQSVDQIGGAGSPFLSNVINQLQPTWDRQRQRALAQAKESAGNLTGSGYGAMLARGLDDQMGRERQELMGYATNALNMELGRQGQLAGFAQQRNLAQPELNLRAGLANQDVSRQLALSGGELGLRAGLANQDTARQYGLARYGTEQSRLLREAELGQQAGLSNQDATNRFSLERFGADNARMMEQARLQQQADLANQGTRQAYDLTGGELGLRAGLANQGMDASFLSSLLDRGRLGLSRDELGLRGGLANMENQRAYDLARYEGGLQRYGMDSDLANSDAQRLTSLLGSLGTAGVGQDELIQTGGAGEILSALGGLLGSGGIGKGGSGLLGGGGVDGQGNWGLLGDLGGGLRDIFGGGGNETGPSTLGALGAGAAALAPAAGLAAAPWAIAKGLQSLGVGKGDPRKVTDYLSPEEMREAIRTGGTAGLLRARNARRGY